MTFRQQLVHTRAAFFADAYIYVAVVLLMWAWLFMLPNTYSGFGLVLLIISGFILWQIAEYLVHRFAFHGPQPFYGWHELHHKSPTSLISTPTWLSLFTFTTLLTTPLWLLFDLTVAIAITSGYYVGYNLYGLIHYWLHSPAISWSWLKTLRARHALHHHDSDRFGFYGVTTPLFDYVFGTAKSKV